MPGLPPLLPGPPLLPVGLMVARSRPNRLWKDHLVSTLNPVPGMRMLDLAGGTGDIAFRCVPEWGPAASPP